MKKDITKYHIERFIREYYKQYYANKLDNLDEMGKHLGSNKLQKLTQEKNRNSE